MKTRRFTLIPIACLLAVGGWVVAWGTASGLALYLGCRERGDGAVIWLGCAGIGVLAGAAWIGIATLGVAGEKLLTTSGGILLAAGHVLNFRRCRTRRCEEEAACRSAEATA